MFIISFSPKYDYQDVILVKNGDTLIANGDVLDFSGLPDGAELPREAIENDVIDGVVSRSGDEVRLTVALPYKTLGYVETPEPIIVTTDGPIKLPEIVSPIEDLSIPEIDYLIGETKNAN